MPNLGFLRRVAPPSERNYPVAAWLMPKRGNPSSIETGVAIGAFEASGARVIPILILAFALAMDAFAVSVVRGSTQGHNLLNGLQVAATFGLAQGLMPLVGWGLGYTFSETFQQVDHWIAFGLLLILGVRMINEGRSTDKLDSTSSSSALLVLIVAAFATSVDAAAAGITLPLMGVSIPLACFAIGAVTAVLCLFGYLLGGSVSSKVGKRAEILGGAILIALGARILFQHTIG